VTQEDIATAVHIAGKRGHLTLHQGRSFECARCGLTGVIGPDDKREGQLFRESCGQPTGVSTC
jgi:hypothetical protein